MPHRPLDADEERPEVRARCTDHRARLRLPRGRRRGPRRLPRAAEPPVVELETTARARRRRTTVVVSGSLPRSCQRRRACTIPGTSPVRPETAHARDVRAPRSRVPGAAPRSVRHHLRDGDVAGDRPAKGTSPRPRRAGASDLLARCGPLLPLQKSRLPGSPRRTASHHPIPCTRSRARRRYLGCRACHSQSSSSCAA